MTIAELRGSYLSGERSPAEVLGDIFRRIRSEGQRPVWISLVDERRALERARTVDLSLPLGGVPFAVKDSIDVAGMDTTAACPAFSYAATVTAPVIQRLLDAGALLVGKTNLDQFATGLVGVRSPYGPCVNPFNSRFIAGGSSSGSAVATATGLCAFAMGTDTAGSGRVPAAFNNLVGVKPTRGLLSTTGIVPACRSLDCVSILAATAADGELVWDLAQGPDGGDAYSRTFAPGDGAAAWLPGPFRFGIPDLSQLDFFGDEAAKGLFERTITRLEAIGGISVPIDFSPFREASALLYDGTWVAERFAAFGDFVTANRGAVNPVVASILMGAARHSAVDAYRCAHRLKELRRLASREWERMDVLVVPTAGTIYTLAEIENDPVTLNSNLGLYTQFVNLMDLAAVAVPAGFRADGLPFGISVVGPAFSDKALLAVARRLENSVTERSDTAPACLLLAVVGAHRQGHPLNHQLTERGARLVRTCRTAPDYRLFALSGTGPPKPGLLRDPGFAGGRIEVELWAVPEHQIGGLLAAIPTPLSIGTITLDDGASVKGVLCESAAAIASMEITRYGSWPAYLRSRGVAAENTVDANSNPPGGG
jgi:allophanate hydrolase